MKGYIVDRKKSERASNSLSSQPGGAAVHVQLKSGVIKIYENVRYPISYIKRIRENDANKEIKEIWTSLD